MVCIYCSGKTDVINSRPQKRLNRIWRRSGKTVLWITHSIDEALFLATHILVMTARPGRIKAVVEIGTDAGGATALAAGAADLDGDVRSRPAFTRYRHEVWALLHDEVRQSDLTAPSDHTQEVHSVA